VTFTPWVLASVACYTVSDTAAKFAVRRYSAHAILGLSHLLGALVATGALMAGRQQFHVSVESVLVAVLMTSGSLLFISSLRILPLYVSVTILSTGSIGGAAILLIAGASASAPQFVGSAAIGLGLYALWSGGSVVRAEQLRSLWIVRCVLAAVLLALGYAILKRGLDRNSVLQFYWSYKTLSLACVGLAVGVRLAIGRRRNNGGERNPKDKGVLAIAALFDAVGQWLMQVAMRLTSSVAPLVVLSAQAVLSLAASRVIVKERLTRREWIGTGLCLVGSVLALW
jgi:drug/metabolite transporter (DMT)-like permease